MQLEVIPPSYEIVLADQPKKLTCPYCDEHIETLVKYQIGSQGFTMCCVTMPCFLCWVPLVLDRFKDAKHSCPNCKQHLGMMVKF